MEIDGAVGSDTSAAGTSKAQHSNLYVKKLPANCDDTQLRAMFSQYRVISSRVSKASRGTTYGFVKLESVGEAETAIREMNGWSTGDSNRLEVKFADADAGPPLAGNSGQLPSDNLYVRNLPSSWSEEQLATLFSAYGTVQACRVLHTGDVTRGAGALVRMGSVEEARRAIEGLNNQLPLNGASQPLVVRYADSPEEKARKQALKERLARQSPYDYSQPPGHIGVLVPPSSALPAGFTAFTPQGLPDTAAQAQQQQQAVAQQQQQQQQQIYADQLMGQAAVVAATQTSGYTPLDLPPPPPQQQPYALGNGLVPDVAATGGNPSQMQSASLYIKNLPPEADKLFMYERFAPHGAILSVKVLLDDETGKCRGVGFVNYTDHASAVRAVNLLHGTKAGDKLLHVSLQTHRNRGM